MKFRKLAVVASVLAVSLISASQPAMSDELDAILENKTMKIAMTGAYPPFNFVNEENKVVGFDPAIGKEIAKRMGVEAVVVTTAWDGIIGGLLANKYDAIVGSMSITEKRQKVVDFVGPYYSTMRAIFTLAGSEVTSVAQLNSVKIGVTLGETHEQWAREQGYTVKTYKGLPELLLELENGRVDAIIGDSVAVILAAKASGRDIAQIEDLVTESVGAGIAIRKGNPELHAAMQKALDEMQADGTYLSIAEEWIGDDIR